MSSESNIQIMKQTYQNLMKDEKFKDLKIEEQEFINMNMGIDAILSPINKNPLNPVGNTTTTTTHSTRFDSDGNYNGHNVNRTRMRRR